MENNEVQVIFMFLTFHTFLIAVVRPFSYSFSKNLLEVYSGLLDKYNASEYFKVIDDYRYWEGGWMHFCCNFWIFAIIIAAEYMLQKFKPIYLCLNFDSLLFFSVLLYLIITAGVMCKQWDFVSKKKYFAISTILCFFLTPFLLCLFRKKLIFISYAPDLSIIFVIWLLSAFYLLFWHLLAAWYPPISELEKAIKKLKGG